MRILMVGNAQMRRWGAMRVSTEYKLWNGFISNGHNVFHFSDRDIAAFLAPFGLRDLGVGRMNRRLIETAENFRPDMILLGHCDLVSNDTLEAIRRKLPDIRIAYRNVDPLFVPKNVEAIHQRTHSVDAIFLTTGGPKLDQFRTKRASIHYMPNPCDPAIETLDNSQKDDLPVDLFFCGNSNEHTERTKTVEFLKEELDGELVFRTPGYFGEPNVWGADYDALLAQSKMGLNLNRQEDYHYSSARLAQLMGNGILAFVDRAGSTQDLLGEEQAAFFEDKDELLKKIRAFHRDDAKRKTVAAEGRRFYRENFSSVRVARQIIETVSK
ncbi:MAG: glycosyltransferase [Opitutales bacterium]